MKSVRNIIPLYNTVNKINDKVQLEIVGSSDLDLQSTENVKVYPNTNKIYEFESKTELFVAILNLHGNQITGKLYHLTATNRPIMVILDGDSKNDLTKYLASFNSFIVCENNKYSISTTINKTILENLHFNPCLLFKASVVAEGFLD